MSSTILETPLLTQNSQRKRHRCSPILAIGALAALFSLGALVLHAPSALSPFHFDDAPLHLISAKRGKKGKKRGDVSAGYGRVGKHRKHPGGRGRAGGQHHHKTHMDQFVPNYFGRLGMRRFTNTDNPRLANQFWCPSIFVDELWPLLSGNKTQRDELVAKYANQKGLDPPVLDVVKLGYRKVMGRGTIQKEAPPFVVQACMFSNVAYKKITEHGGKCVCVGFQWAEFILRNG